MDYIRYHFEEIQSTNDFAKEKAKTEENNFIVTAAFQSNGRGRKGRSFFSPKGSGLYLSIGVKLDISPDKITNITTYTAVCVAKALENLTGLKVDIKWVNDLYVNGKKLCGILTEGIFKDSKLDFAIIGIGINILKTSFPEELQSIATSIETECNKKLAQDAVIDEILKCLGNFEMNDYMEEYKRRSFIIGKEITVLAPDKTYLAKVLDIDNEGYLIIERNGKKEILSSGDVSIRK